MKILIIGAGPAGVTVAETLRECDKKAGILMFSSEDFPPYAQPAMLEYFMSTQEAHLWRWKDIPERLRLDYKPGTRVDAVIPNEHQIRAFDGSIFQYDRLVIATGSRLYAPVPGADKTGIYNFKSLYAAKELIKKVHEGSAKSAIIVGAGFIGVEIAVLLCNLGLDVTLLEMADRIMPRMLDKDTAQIALRLMSTLGIDVRLNSNTLAFLGESKAEAVELGSGETLKADIFIAATGVRPNIEFLRGSGIKTNWGVVVDEHMQSNLPNIYAAGDVAETLNRITGERHVHANFPNAVAQARVVAYNLLGKDICYEGAENMNSLKHLGLPIIAAGRIEGEQLSVRQDDILRKLYLQEGRIVGFQLVGDIKAAGIYRTLMNNKTQVGPIKHRLLDPGFGIGYIPNQSVYQGTNTSFVP